MVMQGLSPKDLKKHPALIPLFACVGLGMLASVVYTLRLATKNPDVSWNKHKNPEPWQEYSTKQYKFMNPSGHDYSQNPAPKY
ncbi:cytochrome c oxidase subunit NDUFA4 [Phymastichus coffea]|uniref:cytochrome c oxidase subunit NDUFA4 n=1 Tax=Phymastichus coffea TaxID=108790 RepID=UPI00273CB898|nr:cytochrome c oxidase subunit NDUFA4 [Phymastichus coffea]